MMGLDKFLEGKDFEITQNEIKSFPEGETELDLKKLEVEDRTIQFDTGEKVRYILKNGDNQYWAGPQIMAGIQAARDKGADRVKVMRQGTGKATNYMVVALE